MALVTTLVTSLLAMRRLVTMMTLVTMRALVTSLMPVEISLIEETLLAEAIMCFVALREDNINNQYMKLSKHRT